LQRKRSFVPEYEAAVFNTPEGSYTPVFKSDYGYHFVKVVEKRGEFYESCHILIAPKVVGEDLIIAQAKADSVYRILTADSVKFEKAAVKYSTDKKTKNQQGKVMNDANGGSRHEIGSLSPEVNLQLQQLQPGEITPPILLNRADGTQAYVIYRLDERKNAHRATMDDDYDIFKAQADAEAKQIETDKWVAKRLKKTYVNVSPEFAGCTFQFPWIKNKP
jgi:peptidyl-prolyl cis-trans isomerase SurA